MSDLYCNQLKCKQSTCDFHPAKQPRDDPVRVYDMRGRCKGEPLKWEQLMERAKS